MGAVARKVVYTTLTGLVEMTGLPFPAQMNSGDRNQRPPDQLT
jgi:hypothetical protein